MVKHKLIQLLNWEKFILECTDCYNTAGHEKAVVRAHYPSMNDCIQCHTGEKISAVCSTCHTKDMRIKPG